MENLKGTHAMNIWKKGLKVGFEKCEFMNWNENLQGNLQGNFERDIKMKTERKVERGDLKWNFEREFGKGTCERIWFEWKVRKGNFTLKRKLER